MLKYIIIISLTLFPLVSCVARIYRIIEKKEYKAIEVEYVNGELPEDDLVLWLGHSSFLIRLKGVTFYTDPVLFDKVVIINRQIPFPIEREKLPAPDFILISHNHYDHMDIPSLRFLEEKARQEKKKPYVFVPERASYYTKDENFITIEMPWDSEYEIKGLNIKSIKVKHFSGRGLFDWNFSLWNAYLISSDDFKILFMGDTAYIKLPELNPDLVLAPIGAWQPRWFMKRNHVSPCEAVQMTKETGGKIMFPMHYGTFRQGADTPQESIEYMIECAEKFGVNYYIPKAGQALTTSYIASLIRDKLAQKQNEQTYKTE